ncbi:GTPase HflX [Erysipelothrix urinaevulpis]|uniref:GTPase HflX n=1 Tax=Erysipelothrix urinaevulpis TaxID=2683717 RepID=UPI0013586F37|nr:GTPase HflX [Erysipelothrix urinaevulpis]
MEKAITIGLQTSKDIQDSMDELARLVEAAGATVIESVIQKRDKTEARTLFGPGKVLEIQALVEELEADLVVVNHELSGSQLRNLEEIIECKIIDRTNLILDIFASRATSKEGQLQVKLAQLQYRLPRIIGFSDYLSRTGGGIGTRGPGEQKLETDRRHVEREIHAIKKQLKTVEKQRETKRKRRTESQVPIVSFVGYTNAGKSTLMNQLMVSEEEVFVKDMLFATLDTSLRKAELPQGEIVLLADTVGFVSELPTALIEAFKSTLEEIKASDIIVHVLDASHDDVELQMSTTNKILDDLEIKDKKILTVFNKMDQVISPEVFVDETGQNNKLYISALSKKDIKSVLNKIESMLHEQYVTATLFIPFEDYSYYNMIASKHIITDEKHNDSGTIIEVKLDELALKPFERFKMTK